MAGGGVGDAYGEDRATEEQLITPWAFSVARSVGSDPSPCSRLALFSHSQSKISFTKHSSLRHPTLRDSPKAAFSFPIFVRPNIFDYATSMMI
jgi:hypothetical protein